MKISYNWLRGYLTAPEEGLDKEITPESVAEILTSIGLEVEGLEKVESVKGGLQGLVIGEVKQVEKHPDADRLSVTKVHIGKGDDLQIVCGAPNVAAGQKVVVATVNTTIHPTAGDPFEIKKAKIRGVASEGMICAEDEIGLGTSHEGIMILPEDAPIGEAASDYFNVESDWVIEIGLTPNRSDANSHIGVARDVKAFLQANTEFNAAINYPETGSFKPDNKNLQIPVEVKDAQKCPRYAGVTLTNVKVGPSPDWLKNKLNVIGVRPINNIVDITNFVLHEYGQPLHVFDADKIAGKKVIVQTLPANTKFTTLDEVERKLHEEDLMICDADGGMCIAGVFGGMDSGITEATTSIFLESAWFDPVAIRKTSGRHTLRTDAATHFEKGIDPQMVVTALKRAALLIKELAGAVIASDIVDIYPAPVVPAVVELNLEYVRDLIGLDIPSDKIVKILHALDFEIIGENEDGIEVKVPTYKVEVTRPADVVEEILRIYGINNIPLPKKFKASVSLDKRNYKLKYQNAAAQLLTAQGFDEMISLSLTQSKYFEKAVPVAEDQLVKLLNSLSSELNVLRPMLLTSGLEAIAYNQNRRNLDLKFFEFGRSYIKKGEGYEEKRHLALYMSGNRFSESWEGKEDPVTFFDMKATVHHILSRFGVNNNTSAEAGENILSSGLEYSVEGKKIVTFGQVDGKILKYFDIKKGVYFADFDWDSMLELVQQQEVKFTEVSKFPAIRRDLAMIIDKGVQYKNIEEVAVKTGKSMLQEINLFDVYEDEKIGRNNISYAVSFIFGDRQKTLTDEEVDRIMNKMISNLERELNATIRK